MTYLAIATLFAERIILGKMKYSEVPRLLKEQVKLILTEAGLANLAS